MFVDKENRTPFYQQIFQGIASEIESGIFKPGDKLPSIRQNAQTLGVSRNTLEQAYLQLVQEGYVSARQGSGYVVNNVSSVRLFEASTSGPSQEALAELEEFEDDLRHASQRLRYDFVYSAMDPSLFPFATWAKLEREVLQSQNAEGICRYMDKRGLLRLREEIASYLGRERGMTVSPAQIAIVSSTFDGIISAASLFVGTPVSVMVEEPGFPDAVQAFAATGSEVIHHQVFPQADYANFPQASNPTRLAYVTPANQYPTNKVMGVRDRKRLIEWARKNDAYLIEDDYCHEYRYGYAQLPSLYALDSNDRVIVVGTFSKSVAPSLCLGYIVLPPQLMLRWMEAGGPTHSIVSWTTQAVLAEFMAQGHWQHHLRKMRRACQEKYRLVTQTLTRTMGDKVEFLDYENGLHLLVRTTDSRSSEELIELAAQHDVQVYSTSQYWFTGVPDSWNYVLLGYSGIAKEDIVPGIEALAQAWFLQGA